MEKYPESSESQNDVRYYESRKCETLRKYGFPEEEMWTGGKNMAVHLPLRIEKPSSLLPQKSEVCLGDTLPSEKKDV
jgi:hypothetical protein